jgi:hypothetical protein
MGWVSFGRLMLWLVQEMDRRFQEKENRHERNSPADKLHLEQLSFKPKFFLFDHDISLRGRSETLLPRPLNSSFKPRPMPLSVRYRANLWEIFCLTKQRVLVRGARF